MQALIISAFYAGVAGGLLVFWTRYLNPNTFADTRSNDLLSTLVTGGTNSISGPILAASILIFALEYLRSIAEWRLVIYGALLVLLMRFRPQGIMGYKEFSIKAVIAFFKDYKAIPAKCRACWNRLVGHIRNKIPAKQRRNGK